MKCPLPFILIVTFVSTGIAFEPFDYKKVPSFATNRNPFGNDMESTFIPLAETLCDIALYQGYSDQQKAQILAAARRLDPLNRKAFSVEYLLSIGEAPPAAPVLTSEPKTMLDPHIERLRAFPDTGDYITFLLSAIAIDTDTQTPWSKPANASEGDTAPIPKNTCYLLTMDGCHTITANSQRIAGSSYQFNPGNLDTDYFRSAYRESMKYLALGDTAGLSGQRLNFETEFEPDDTEGPGAALACAVLTKAAAHHYELDPIVAYAGDVNADGSIQPLDDQKDRILAKPKSITRILVIPKADTYALDDILLMNGPGLFAKVEIYSASKLDEAIAVGRMDRSSDLKEAMKLYTEIQQTLRTGGGKQISSPQVRKKLNRIIKLAPNHLSAKLLKRVSFNRYPAYISLVSSFDLIFASLEPVFAHDKEIKSWGKLDPEAFSQLKRYRNRLDPSLQPLVNAVFTFENSGRVGGNTQNERARVVQRLKDELGAVSRNVRIREKMMR